MNLYFITYKFRDTLMSFPLFITVVYAKTIIHLSVGVSDEYLHVPPLRRIIVKVVLRSKKSFPFFSSDFESVFA